jgi:hypothetical protein
MPSIRQYLLFHHVILFVIFPMTYHGSYFVACIPRYDRLKFAHSIPPTQIHDLSFLKFSGVFYQFVGPKSSPNVFFISISFHIDLHAIIFHPLTATKNSLLLYEKF